MRKLTILLLLSFMSSILNIGPSLAISENINCTAGGFFTVTSNVVTGNTDCTGIANVPEDVISIGNAAFFGNTALTSITIPNSVTSIGNYAFYGNTALSSVTIPDSMISIGDWAFESTGLTSLTLGNSLEIIGEGAFTGNASLTSITIPNSVTSIGANAFSSNTALTSVTIGSGVTSIGNYAFSGLTALTSITIPNSVTSTGNYVFSGNTSLASITIPDSVLNIGEGAFVGNTALTSITIPNSVTSIGRNAFENTALTSITIPNSVTSIGIYAFINNAFLTSVTIGDNVTTIGDYAFENNAALTSVTIGNSVETIGEGAFYGNTALTEVVIPDSVTSIGASAFQGNTALTEVTIGSGVTSIGNYAFYGNTVLNSVTIGSGVNSIGESAFQGNSALTSLTIPDSVTSIGSAAFFDNISLASVTIGSGVTSIGRSAFQNTALTSLTIPNSVTYIGDGAFYGNTSLASVAIGNNVLEISANTFENNISLTSVTIGSGVTSIGASAFRNTALTSLTIPNSVTSIGASAFRNTALTEVTIGSGVTSIGASAFEFSSSLTSLRFLGNAPTVTTSSFENLHASATAFVSSSTSGFDDSADGVEDEKWYELSVRIGLSADATLATSSTIKGQSLIDLGVPNATLASATVGSVTISSAKALNTSNSTTFVTAFTTTSDSATVIKVVKYADGASTSNFETSDSAYANQAITNRDFFIVKVLAQDGNTTLYYKIVIAVSESSGGAPAPMPVIPTYRITYSGNASDVVDVPTDYNRYISGQKITVTSQLPLRTGYSFLEWNSSIFGGATSYQADATITVDSSNVTLYAQWKINQYTISFDSNGGRPLNWAPITQDFNSILTVPALPQDGLRIGYSFLGWSTKASGTSSLVAPSDKLQIGAANVTLYAQWKINQYTVAYEGNGNEIGRVPSTVIQDFDSKVTVSSPSKVFRRKGYSFTGWSLTKDASETYFKVGDTFALGASNQTFYAIWTPNTYLVTFLNTSKDLLPKGQFVSGGVIASSPTPPSRKGFLFKGWSSKADKSDIVKFPYAPGVFRNITLYAIWAKSR